MKITFLGTSDGVPRAARHCSSTMLELNGATYLFDAGAPVVDILLRRGVELTSVRSIFTTHLHGDHVNGVLDFAYLCTWYHKTASLDIYLTEQEGIDGFRSLIRTMLGGKLCDDRVRFKLMTPEIIYEDENIRVTPFPTQHMRDANRPAYSYLIEAEGKKVLLSGDLSHLLAKEDFPVYALENEVDLMVCEMAHFDVEHVQPYLERCKAKDMRFNHVAPLSKLDKINALGDRFGYPIRTVEDGEVIEL